MDPLETDRDFWLDALKTAWPPSSLVGKLSAPAIAFHAAPHWPANPSFDLFRVAYAPQQTGSACSLASVTLAINVLAGNDLAREGPILTQDDVLNLVDHAEWRSLTLENGSGVTFSELVERMGNALSAMQLSAGISAHRPAQFPNDDAGLFRRDLLAMMEAPACVILLYFNQGVLTGDWDGPHVSPVGGYDAASDRVLIMEVDRELPLPYWAPLDAVMVAMTKPVKPDHGRLAGQTGGWLFIRQNA